MPSLYTSRGDEPIFQQEKLNNILILTMIEDPAAANYASKRYHDAVVRCRVIMRSAFLALPFLPILSRKPRC